MVPARKIFYMDDLIYSPFEGEHLSRGISPSDFNLGIYKMKLKSQIS